MFCQRDIKHNRQRTSKETAMKDRRKEVKRRRGQQLASTGLELTSSFCKGFEQQRRGELKECSGLFNPLCPYYFAPPPISPQQNRVAGEEGREREHW